MTNPQRSKSDAVEALLAKNPKRQAKYRQHKSPSIIDWGLANATAAEFVAYHQTAPLDTYFNCRVSGEVLAAMQRLAKRRGLTVSGLVMRGVAMQLGS